MNKRCVLLEELEKGAEPLYALEASTQHYINVIMRETMPIRKADIPVLLAAVKTIDKVISEDNPEAAQIAGIACDFFMKHGKVERVETENREDMQEIHKKFFNAPQ